MEGLSLAQLELVALGAALGSNCVPCIEYHIPEARRAGLTDRQINEAISLADKVRQVPARKVVETALRALAEASAPSTAEPKADAQSVEADEAGPVVAQSKHDDTLAAQQSAGSDKGCCA